MDINGWLTIITIFIAVYALLPADERELQLEKISKWEGWVIIIIVLIFIPILIFFNEKAERLSFMKYFIAPNGIKSKNLAFILFYASLLWLIIRMFMYQKPNKNVIEHFINLLPQRSFSEFFSLFTKFNKTTAIQTNWKQYKQIILHPKFLNGCVQNEPSYLLKFWSNLKNEEDFKTVLLSFLKNPESLYYKEIKESGSDSKITENNQFLNTVIIVNIEQAIRNYIFHIISDFSAEILMKEKIKGISSIYNQEHYHHFAIGEEGFDLSLYYHICFIHILYREAIDRNGQNILDNQDPGYWHMTSLYSEIIKRIIENIIISIPKEQIREEYPTNYHWLISIIFEFQKRWLYTLTVQKDENPDMKDENYYVSFVLGSIGSCVNELFDAYKIGEQKVISESFLKNQIHSILWDYYREDFPDNFRELFEKDILDRIPDDYFLQVLEFSLWEAKAIWLEDVKKEDFVGKNDSTIKILNRIRDYLKNRKLI